LVGEGGGPDGAVPGFLDVVFVGTLSNVEATVSHHGLQPFVGDDLVELKRLVHQVARSDVDAHTGTFLDILVGSVFDRSYYVAHLHVLLPHTDLATYQALQVLHRDELVVDLHEVRSGVATNVEKDAHLLSPLL
jgi:hypothetical protein